MKAETSTEEAAIGVIGGSGVYHLDGLAEIEEREIETPYGKPSEVFVGGRFAGRKVWFLARHGRHHSILPTEVNHRANLWALRSLGVRWIICATAVGSLREEYPPRSIVLPRQYYDRTSRREHHTFFGEGIVGHVSFAEPISEGLRELLFEAGQEEGADIHNGGTYVCMDGPAFSTRAECAVNRSFGFDIIGMTNLPEAKLAREAEIALATLGLVTDYDCWSEEVVSAEVVGDHLAANAAMAKAILQRVIPRIPGTPDWPEHRSLEGALFTPKVHWPTATVEKLRPILGHLVE
ncbi:MAG: S-methyl-5'-thioadenosine phosphorylase [Verrucomicrobiales bacterium]